MIAGQQLRQRAVADAEQLHVGDLHVDADNRDAAAGSCRQDEAVAGEADGGAAILHIDGQHNGCLYHLADRGRQPLAEGHVVVLAVLEAHDTDFLVSGLDCFRRRIVDRNERRIVDTGFHQFFRELGADARRGCVCIHRVLDHAEALAGLQVLIFCAQGCGIDEREAGLIGLQRLAEQIAAIQADGHCRQRVGPCGRRAHQLIRVPACIGCLAIERRGFRAIIARNRQQSARQT